MTSLHIANRVVAIRTSIAMVAALFLLVATVGSSALAANDDGSEESERGLAGDSCKALPGHEALAKALAEARDPDGDPETNDNGGLNTEMWGAIVNRDGVVCAVAFTGDDRGDQWPGSRVIAAQKASTANAFSLPGLALATANLYSAVQPGGSLFGLQASNPVDTGVAYQGPTANYGRQNDPMAGSRIGGVNVFGGGLALYDSDGRPLGAVGVSGDTSCADHNIAWRTRHNLGLNHVPDGVAGDDARPDNIIFDIQDDEHGNPESAGGFGHPHCLGGNADTESALAAALPAIPQATE